jgi:hypothetical protein
VLGDRVAGESASTGAQERAAKVSADGAAQNRAAGGACNRACHRPIVLRLGAALVIVVMVVMIVVRGRWRRGRRPVGLGDPRFGGKSRDN